MKVSFISKKKKSADFGTYSRAEAKPADYQHFIIPQC
jgi:hypothetical protein